jgi:hypothetical protein
MNEKIMNMGFFIFFIMIGINGFIVMTGTLIDTNGTPMSEITGLTGVNALGSDINTSASTINLDPSAGAGSTTTETLPPFEINEKPAGLNASDAIVAGVAGTQIFLLRFSEPDMFPFLEPILYAVVFFVTAIQLLIVAYLGSIVLRTIFGGKI